MDGHDRRVFGLHWGAGNSLHFCASKEIPAADVAGPRATSSVAQPNPLMPSASGGVAGDVDMGAAGDLGASAGVTGAERGIGIRISFAAMNADARQLAWQALTLFEELLVRREEMGAGDSR